MKIALYLGSFNPFHLGHVEVITKALKNFKMDKVIIIPTMKNPWKKEKVLDLESRMHILEYSLMYELYKNYIDGSVDWDLIEKELIPPYYSYATLHALKNKYCNDEIFILCGEDTIENIPNWMNGEQIIKDYDFLIVDRSINSISSTEVREKIKNNQDINNLVCKEVINLIKNYYK